jgi:hypothetical protein
VLDETTIKIALGLIGRFFPGAPAAVTSFKSSALAGAFGALAGLAFIAAAGMGCAALWSAVAPYRGPVDASLAVAGALVLVGLVLVLIGWRIHRAGIRRIPPPRMPTEQFEAIAKALGDVVGEHKAGALIAAMLAGAAADQASRQR